jgi:hypothetical protein
VDKQASGQHDISLRAQTRLARSQSLGASGFSGERQECHI